MIAGQIGMIKRGAKYLLPVIPVLKRINGSYDNIFGRRHPMPGACEKGAARVGAPSRWQMPSLDHVT